ncbi:MAG: tRNA lysidine(34) synthetase TilS [Flavobacteriales bacterium]
MDLIKAFQTHLNSLNLDKHTSYFLALSGGSDSVCLFHLLRLNQIHFKVLHCNFQLRGSASDEDEMFVQKLCSNFGIDCQVKTFDTKHIQNQIGKGIQELARNLRYEWFETVASESENAVILTAHHINDSIETLLFNLLRGSDLKGLCGIQNRGRYWRPLLDFEKSELTAFLNQHQFECREDQSNQSNEYARNFIRNQVLPLTKTLFPNQTKRLSKTIENLQENQQFIDNQLDEIRTKLFENEPGGFSISIPKLKNKALSPFFLKKLFSPFGFTDQELFSKLFDLDNGKKLLSASHHLIKYHEQLFILDLSIENQSVVFESKEALGQINAVLQIRAKDCTLLQDWRINLNEDLIQFPLTLRTCRAGDVFFPEGMLGKKKVSSYFKDLKMNPLERKSQWILTDQRHILWIVGRRKDRRTLAKESDKNKLHLVFKNQD